MAAVGDLTIEQVLISATPEDTLERQLAPHALSHHFAQIHGIADAYAASKADVVESWLTTSGHDPRRVLMIGDTNHDEEIADTLRIQFIRFRNGHQKPPAHRRHTVVSDLRDVVTRLTRTNSGNR